MKIGKKTGMIASFIVGATIFASTAIADIVSQNGYDQLKTAAKFTAESCAGKLNSFTGEYSYVVKFDGEVVDNEDETSKYNNVNNISENVRKEENLDRKDGCYTYADEKCMIQKYNSDNFYNEEDYGPNEKRLNKVENPFKKNGEKDLEKILDALVGDIKNYVVVSEESDGSKKISGSLTETQIPTIVNALISYGYKNSMAEELECDQAEKQRKSRLTDDIYLKEGKLTAGIDKEGLLNNFLVTGTISGKDKEGKVHNVSIEFLFKLYDINSTVVNKPNLEGKKVNKSMVNNDNYKQIITKKCIGKYTNDIILEKDDKFIKIGERTLEITNVDNTDSDKITVKCKYHEEYKKEYAGTYKATKDMNFDVNVNKYDSFGTFIYTDGAGSKKRGTLSASSDTPGLTMALNIERNIEDNVNDDGIFSRSFDK